MIFFRVNGSYSSGIGHIKRAIKLAQALKEKYEIIFLVDSIKELPRAFIPSWLILNEIYCEGSRYRNEEEDANLCIKALENNSKISAIIVDDYRLGAIWEKKIKKKLTPNLFVFDDRDEIEHHCSVLIDSRYVGAEIKGRYEGKTNPECIKLLGPKYFFAPKKNEKKELGIQENKIILISIGGGGDLEIIAPAVKRLLEDLDSKKLEKIYLIAGPFSKNSENIAIEIKDYRLEVVINSPDLTEHLREASVYIGSSGTTLFEALSMGCTCLSFSMAQNQINDKKNLEAFGHYFHINKFEENEREGFAELCKNFYIKRARIKELQKNAIVELDDCGVDRVANILMSQIQQKEKNSKPLKNIYVEHKSKIYSGQLDRHIRRIQDTDINAYLLARNLKKNADNMTVTSVISEIEHYNWWLINKRESYVMEKNKIPLMYIWHQVKQINSATYLIGGWFVADENLSPLEVMASLKYQLDLTKEKYPEAIWLAIIKKTNKFVKKLNEKYGFKLVGKKEYEDAIESLFPKVDKKEFDYYYK